MGGGSRADESPSRAASLVPPGSLVSPASLEFAVADVAAAEVARALGATRVELCAALGPTGGLTPSIGLVAAVVEVGIPVHVLIRPRAGGFVYTDAELAVSAADVRAVLDAGASGVVVGALTTGGGLTSGDGGGEGAVVDEAALERLVSVAHTTAPDAEITFHRAFDVVTSRDAALDALARFGVTRVLTSGGAARSGDAIDELGRLARLARGRVQIMAGGGVRVADIRPLIDAGVDAVHLSARLMTPTGPGGQGPGGGTANHDELDPALAAAAAAEWRAALAR